MCEKCEQLEVKNKELTEQLNEFEEYITNFYLENKRLKKNILKYKKNFSTKKVGRPALSKKDIFMIRSFRHRCYSYRQISDMTGYSKSVIFKYCHDCEQSSYDVLEELKKLDFIHDQSGFSI